MYVHYLTDVHIIISYVATCTTEQVIVLKNLLFQVITEAVYELLETKENLQRVKLPVNQLMRSFLNNCLLKTRLGVLHRRYYGVTRTIIINNYECCCIVCAGGLQTKRAKLVFLYEQGCSHKPEQVDGPHPWQWSGQSWTVG